MRMKRSSYINLFTALCPSFNHLEVSRDSFSLLIVHISSPFVADPGMGTSSPRVNPQYMLKPEIISQGGVDNFDRHSHK